MQVFNLASIICSALSSSSNHGQGRSADALALKGWSRDGKAQDENSSAVASV
jgi:hypothetical protein